VELKVGCLFTVVNLFTDVTLHLSTYKSVTLGT